MSYRGVRPLPASFCEIEVVVIFIVVTFYSSVGMVCWACQAVDAMRCCSQLLRNRHALRRRG